MSDAVSISRQPATGWKLPFSPSELALLLQAMLDEAGYGGSSLELALLDDEAMERLNRKCAGLVGPTNILSFSVPDEAPCPTLVPGGNGRQGAGGGRDRPCLGWLALSADTLLRECFLYGRKPEEHCIRLLAHGLAHLTGLDHGPEMDLLAGRMEGRISCRSVPGRT